MARRHTETYSARLRPAQARLALMLRNDAKCPASQLWFHVESSCRAPQQRNCPHCSAALAPNKTCLRSRRSPVGLLPLRRSCSPGYTQLMWAVVSVVFCILAFFSSSFLNICSNIPNCVSIATDMTIAIIIRMKSKPLNQKP